MERHVTRTIAKNTRQFVLGGANPFFFQGRFAGVGSPHTGQNKIWPLAIAMRAMTTNDPKEINQQLNYLEDSTAGTHFMHESFDVNDPSHFTRRWFGWANSLFSELVLMKLDVIEERH